MRDKIPIWMGQRETQGQRQINWKIGEKRKAANFMQSIHKGIHKDNWKTNTLHSDNLTYIHTHMHEHQQIRRPMYIHIYIIYSPEYLIYNVCAALNA